MNFYSSEIETSDYVIQMVLSDLKSLKVVVETPLFFFFFWWVDIISLQRSPWCVWKDFEDHL